MTILKFSTISISIPRKDTQYPPCTGIITLRDKILYEITGSVYPNLPTNSCSDFCILTSFIFNLTSTSGSYIYREQSNANKIFGKKTNDKKIIFFNILHCLFL